MTIVLIGPHGVGKTTLGQLLARRLGVPFHDEIGRRLASDPLLRPDGQTALARQEAFDEAVHSAELARDVASPAGETRVVETWHPGNLAFASARSPGFVDRHLPSLRRHVQAYPAGVILLRASPHVLLQRQSEPGPLAFFMQVGQKAEAFAQRLGLPVLAVLETGEASPEVLAARLLGQIRGYHR